MTPVYHWLTSVTGRPFHKYVNPSRCPLAGVDSSLSRLEIFIKVMFPVADPREHLLCACGPVL